jgi:hypothetical protein
LMTAITEGRHNHLYLGSATDFNNGGLVRRRDQHINGINGNCKTPLKHYSLLRQKDVKRTSSFIVLMNVPIDIEEATKEDLWAVRLLSFVERPFIRLGCPGMMKTPRTGQPIKGRHSTRTSAGTGHAPITDHVQPIGKIGTRAQGVREEGTAQAYARSEARERRGLGIRYGSHHRLSSCHHCFRLALIRLC